MKKLITFAISIVFLFCFCLAAYANGGPGDGRDLLIGGNIKFIETPDILLVAEDLSIKVFPKSSEVMVRYTLKNTGAARNLSYIFPVTKYKTQEEWTPGLGGEMKGLQFYDNGKLLQSEKLETERIGKLLDYGHDNEMDYYDEEEEITLIEKLEFFYNNLDSNFNFHYEMARIEALQDDYDEEVVEEYEGKETTIGGLEFYYSFIDNEYYKTTLSFAKDETKTLTVTYEAPNHYSSYENSKYLLPDYSDVLFVYDLRPAAAWGNGKAGTFNLSLDYTALEKSKKIMVNLKNFKRDKSGKFTYTKRDFDFKKQGLITVKYDYPFEMDDLKAYQLGEDCLDSIYVSKTLDNNTQKYGIKNALDRNRDVAWAASMNGKPPQIEFIMDDRMSNLQIGILNGYVKSEKLYYDNARIKKLKVEVLTTNEATAYTSKEKIVEEHEVYEFKDIPYRDIEKKDTVELMEILYCGYCADRPIRLTVLETYPGRKYNDVVISGLYFFAEDGREWIEDEEEREDTKGFKVLDTSIFQRELQGETPKESDKVSVSTPPAVTSNEASETKPSSPATESPAKAPSLLLWYILGGALVVLLAGVGIVIVRVKRKNAKS